MRRRRRQLVGIGSGTCSLFTSILLLLVLFGASDGEDHRAIDRAALLLFKGSVSSDPAGLLRGWKDSLGSDHCSWPGVSCDARFRVSALEIAGVGTADAGDRSLYSRRLWRWKCAHTARRLSGRLSPAVGRLSELRILALPCHSFDGEIPSEIWELQNLEVLDLQGNSVSGFLPSRFPGALRVLNLAFNRIGGEVPLSLSRCLNLEMVDLSRNQITGAVPPFLGRLPKLRVLSLASNRLRGSLPAEIGDGCQSLEHLDLSGNLLIKRIPARLGNCGELRSLLLFSNFLRGFLPPEIGRLTKLQVLDVSRNRLRGPVPEEIGNCTEISVLILSNCNPLISPSVNRSSGHGDDSNEFDGGLPASIVNLSKLRVLRAPWSLPLKGVIPQSSRSRRLAGGASTQSYSNGTPPPLAGESGRVMNSVEIAAVTSATVIVSVLFGLIIYYFYKRKCAAPRAAAADSSSLSRELTLFTDIGVPLTYEKVVRATGGFNSSNCIGSGGFGATYKAELAGGVIVAIKRLAVGRFNAGVQQFHAEIKTLGRWRHPNLVTLIGFHCSESEMFLIYNFLPGGNLERFIQSRAASAPDWRRLHCIALDVAQALAYLHDECSPRILHRDVKPSNILLDKELKAYLSDFGLARLLGSSETHATTGVAGTFGYVAPEYAMTCRVSDKADVYSYGVVLLELLSDKKALDPSFSQYGNGFNLVTWAAMMLRRGQAREFFAAGLWDAAPHDDLVETLHLGVSCTSDVTTGRPTMKHVVQRLKQLRPPAR